MSGPKAATIRDVAQAAGVSVTAVSRHLNKQIVLPPETALRIDGAVLSLGYRPNAIARRLSRGVSETLGFVTSDIAYPFFAEIASTAEEEAGAHGFSLAIFNSRNQAAHELDFLARIEDLQVDGVLLMTNHPDDGTLRDRIGQYRKVVLIDEDVPGTSVPKVFASNEEGGLIATRHLIELGHRRIGFITGPRGMLSCEERFAGFSRAMAEAGLSIDPQLVQFGVYDDEFGAVAFERFWAADEPPTAVFSSADMLSIGLIRAARAHGVSLPDDLSIASFDDLLHADLLDPPLTTVRQSAADFGRYGVRLLLACLDGQPTPEPQRIPVQLIVRGSAVPLKRRRRGRRTAASIATGGGQAMHLEGIE